MVNNLNMLDSETNESTTTWRIVELEEIKLSHLTLNYTLDLLKLNNKTQQEVGINFWTNEELISTLAKNALYDQAFILINAFYNNKKLINLQNQSYIEHHGTNILLNLVDRCIRQSDSSSGDATTEYDLVKLNQSCPVSLYPYEK